MPTPESVFDLLAARPGSVWLDAGRAGDGWSILAWNPASVVTDPTDWPMAGRALNRAAPPSPLPFTSGCIGFLGYGAGARVAPVPRSAPSWEPDIWLGRYEGALCYRQNDGTWHPAGHPTVQAEGRALLARAVELGPPGPPPSDVRVRTTPRAVFEAGVRTTLEWIAEGDCYQLNLTRPVFVDRAGAPWPAYRRLRGLSGPDRGAYLTLDADTAILSNSPETFLAGEAGSVWTDPIKGTRPRGHDASTDAALIDALERSSKELAELTMIVDLCRNDLGRVAAVGSVSTERRRIVHAANVHHAARRVHARLAPGEDSWSALAACFPPGSVTGAPKVRACQRISELESAPRGVYCGAIGYVADHGRTGWNVAIRSAVFHRGDARYHVGSGIVADSDPSAEWEETVDKGTLLATALTGVARPEPRP